MELILVRHGLPVRVEGADGPADPVLAEAGWAQAERVAARLAKEGIDHIVASPLRRARQTAEPLAGLLHLSVEEVDGLAEWDRHSDSYIPMEELKAESPAEWLRHATDPAGVMGEDPELFRARVVEAAEGIIGANPGRSVAAFCHGGVINALVAWVLGLEQHVLFEPAYCGITRLAASRTGVRSIVSVNDVGHHVS